MPDLLATGSTPAMSRQIEIDGIQIDLAFKKIKNLNLRILSPDGQVRISAPKRTPLKHIHAFVLSKMDWIRRHQARIADSNHQPPLRYQHRELHQAWGKPCILYIVEDDRPPFVELTQTRMILHERPGTCREKRRKIVETWRRDQVTRAAEPLFAKWEPVMGVKVAHVSVRRMKTRWGSCSHIKRTIRLNSSLSAKAPELLEYVVVHELAHLLEPSHNHRFAALMEQFLPDWRRLRKTLNHRAEQA